MDVEDVAGIGLAPGRLVGEKRDLAVGRGVLGQVVDDHQRVTAAVAEILRHGEGGEGSGPEQPGRGRGARHHEDAAIRRAVGPDRVDDPLYRRRFLADRDIDADNVAAPLIDDAVDGERGLADGPVTDDQLALAAAERKHRIDDE